MRRRKFQIDCQQTAVKEFVQGMAEKAELAVASISSRFPAYAPASASILFPAFWFAAERRDSLVRVASSRSRTGSFAPAQSPLPVRLYRLPSGCPAAVFRPYCLSAIPVAYLFLARC